ncbi:zinc ribbon domain-containing protein [Clostridium magnum]|uniref:Double zinc ribbon n=1 Tax=Clostridium magnum DSM 2767 TaxID=1121326 RepID=A0A161XDE8_9CLOT|nr:zinc ribbon domain-containing protein [Clostridium magnum]KZL92376.1 double zinc ribbon [Clostridium magnum DSM 2767]SHH11559.1 replication restart DNA helicase PriA [Clostridium magnum DSM 2767]
MSDKIKFVRNHSDLSTDKGFQFEFYCDRCGTGYRTRFKTSATGIISQVLDAASGFFGGIFQKTADLTNRVHSAAWEKSHDDAFVEAVKEVENDFIQCPKCQSWVCKERCWNNNKGLCKDCAPDLGVEMSAAQASRSVEEVWAHAEIAEEDKKLDKENWKDVIRASCPKCGCSLEKNSKFCPDCGEKLTSSKHCPECGEKLNANAKFCISCGKKIEE